MMKKMCFFAAVATLLSFTGCEGNRDHGGTGLFVSHPHDVMFGGNKVHYVTVGRGRHNIVFVHCWAGNNDFWREQIPDLADKARLILVDLPGHGQSDKPHTAYTMDFLASAVLAVMRDAHADKAVLVGHSMGVPVICRVYKQAPEKVAALVSIDGWLKRPAMSPADVDKFIAPLRGPDYREHTTKFIGAMFPTPGTESLRERTLSEMLKTPQYVMVSAMEGMFRADQPDWDLKKVNVPVLVINTKNPMWTPEYQTYVHSLSTRVDYRQMDGVGHWLMLEEPVQFNVMLTDMLRKQDLISK
jgi:pimeloyl-ACP methyl ester carboxylesterase